MRLADIPHMHMCLHFSFLGWNTTGMLHGHALAGHYQTCAGITASM